MLYVAMMRDEDVLICAHKETDWRAVEEKNRETTTRKDKMANTKSAQTSNTLTS